MLTRDNASTARAKSKKSTLASRSVHRSLRPHLLPVKHPSPNRAAPHLGDHYVAIQRLKLNDTSLLHSQAAGIHKQSYKLPRRDGLLSGGHPQIQGMNTIALYTTSHQIPLQNYLVARRGGGLVCYTFLATYVGLFVCC